MAFCILAYKAWKINRKVKRLEREKKNAARLYSGKTPVYTLEDKWHHFWSRCRFKIRLLFAYLCALGPDSAIEHFWIKLHIDGTYENFVAKSILGFLGGMLLTYVFFIFFVIQLHFAMATAAMWCSLFGLFLTLGLAFSQRIRVVVFMLLPVLFSKRGRQALVAYAFILTLSGPVRNALRNTEILSESLSCGQEELKSMTQHIKQAIKKPMLAIKEALKKVMKTIKVAVKKIKELLLALKRIIMTIVKVIKGALLWLGSIINICNKKVGTPFQRCMRVFEGAVVDCQAKMGIYFSWLCSIAYVVSAVCYAVKIFDFICMFIDFLNNNVIDVVKAKMRTFMRHVHDIFYVSVEFRHSFTFETNQSASMQEIGKGIVTEIQHKTKRLMTLFDWMGFGLSFFLILIFVKVLQYHHKFLINDRFDNHYITEHFIDIDMRRAMLEQESILPLTKREQHLYIRTKSVRLIKAEKMKIAKSAIFLGVTSAKIGVCILVDYCLFWVMAKIQRYGSIQTYVDTPASVQAHVIGEGLLADLFRVVVKAFQPLGVGLNLDTTKCLPSPIPPNTDLYFQIVSLILLCWILTIVEPYGLRIRHSIMCYYYPDRAQQRAVWLYNHILRSRGCFLKFARRQLRRKFGKSKDGVIEKVTIMDRFRALCPWAKYIFGKSTQQMCLMCARVLREGDKEELINCPTPQCIGKFCNSCYDELKKICTICKNPMEYGDISDISEERDSSDEPMAHSEPQYRKIPHKAKMLQKTNTYDVERGLLMDRSCSSESSFEYQEEHSDTAVHPTATKASQNIETKSSINISPIYNTRKVSKEKEILTSPTDKQIGKKVKNKLGAKKKDYFVEISLTYHGKRLKKNRDVTSEMQPLLTAECNNKNVHETTY